MSETLSKKELKRTVEPSATALFEQAESLETSGQLEEEERDRNKKYADAIEVYIRAAELGDVRAMFRLGLCYDKPDFMFAFLPGFDSPSFSAEPDKWCQEGAEKWYRKAVEKNHTHAMNHLASILLTESWKEEDPENRKAKQLEPIELLKLSNKLQSPEAGMLLGRYYLDLREDEEARYWFGEAHKLGNSEASTAIDILNKQRKAPIDFASTSDTPSRQSSDPETSGDYLMLDSAAFLKQAKKRKATDLVQHGEHKKVKPSEESGPSSSSSSSSISLDIPDMDIGAIDMDSDFNSSSAQPLKIEHNASPATCSSALFSFPSSQHESEAEELNRPMSSADISNLSPPDRS